IQLHALHLEQARILLGERVTRLGQDLDQRILGQLLERRDYRQTTDELRNQAVLDQVFRLHVLEYLTQVAAVVLALHFRRETDAALFRTRTDNLVETGKGTATDEQDVGGVHLQELLLRMLAPALRRHGSHRSLDQFKQRLLHAFAADIAGDRRVVGLARNLVDLVDIDDALLRLLDIVVALLQQFLDDVFHVLADITGFGQGGRIRDGERHIQLPRQRFSQPSLSGTRRTNSQDVGLDPPEYDHALATCTQALVMNSLGHGL